MKSWKVHAARVALAAALFAAPARAEDAVRVATAEPALDLNGDGFLDVIFVDRAVHRDLDLDGRFDYTLALAFKEYTSAGHRRYVESAFSPDVFAELTRAGLDQLCASERMAANWTAAHFREFPYYHDGYGALRIFDGSPGNDGRLAGKAARPRYEYRVVFNPDGTVATVERGDTAVDLATFDYEKNVSSGTTLRLRRIERPEDLAAIRVELGRLFEPSPAPH